jgi:hypothetical protein
MWEVIMNNEVKSESFRKLSIIALILGILTYSYVYLIPQLIFFLVFTLRDYIQNEITIASIVGIIVFILMGLPITAIVCGSIDLKKVKAGLSSVKGRGFDISGIVLGSIFILAVLMFLLGEIIVPH